MTNTYTWQITSMQCYPEHEGETDVVFLVSWICTASDYQTPSNTATIPGTTSVTYTAGNPYTPYADLTQDQVLGWVWGVINKDDIQAYLDTQINAITPPLPWSK